MSFSSIIIIIIIIIIIPPLNSFTLNYNFKMKHWKLDEAI